MKNEPHLSRIPLYASYEISMRKPIFIIVVLAYCQLAYAEPTYPPIAEKAGSLELGAAIVLLMPDKGAKVLAWDNQANGPIVWLTDGYKTEEWANGDTVTARTGLLRVNVLGKFAHVLKQQKQILAWTVRYSTKANPKWGVETISLSPGVPGEECFGTLNDGCSFDLLPSLKKTGLSVKKICEVNELQERIVAYQVSHPNKETTNVVLNDGWGSGGSVSSVDMNLAEPNENLCR